MAAPGDEIEALEGVLGHVQYPGAPGARTPQIFVDPQAAKIPRSIRPIHLPAGTTVPSAGRTVITIPRNEIWKLVSLFIDFAATATVGTRELVLSILDSTGVRIWRSTATSPTAGQSDRIRLMRNGVSVGTFTSSISSNDLLPDGALMPDWTVVLDDLTNVDVLDTFTLDGYAEAWTFPRGLARDEIPMGLESGFLWDLTEPRKVA